MEQLIRITKKVLSIYNHVFGLDVKQGILEYEAEI
jgi:hypothetical protein